MGTAIMASDVSPKLRIDFPMAELEALCRKWKVRKLAIFGSAVRDDFTDGSDVDVLYRFEPDQTLGWYIVDFHDELVTLFGGRKVDLVSFDHIYWRIRKRVLSEAVTVYERQ